jgi:dTDP-3-amino-3,4,6-trideoxy-alpha-D-glucose transaminase
VKVPFLDLGRQTACCRGELDAAVARVLDRARYVLDTELESFEREWAAFCGARFAVGVGNGTQALEIALRASGIGPGHEVITSPLTAPFTAQAILGAGAIPVFADVDERTLLLDPAAAEGAVTPRTRAILPVHLYGRVADLEAFADITRRHGLDLVQDACQAHGAALHGRPLTAWSRWVAYSFYPTKNLGALGDGGALVTDHADAAEAARLLRNGGVRSQAISELPALNSRLDEIQAALLRAKLPHLAEWNERRRQLAAFYAREIGPPVGGIPAEPGSHVYHLYVVRVERRAELQQFLAGAGIGTMVHYPRPLHWQAAFGGSPACAGTLPVVERACREIISLPLDPQLEDAEAELVINAIRDYRLQATGSAERGMRSAE